LLTLRRGSDHDRARAWQDRLGRRAKRFLTPLQKYELWLQLVCGETTISEAADQYGMDRSTIVRLRTVAKDGPLQALAESKQARQDLELEAAQAEAARLGEAVRELGVSWCWWRERASGLAGRVPPRVDQATKAGLLDLLCQATQAGWTVWAACQVLEVSELRVYRWLGRRAAGELPTRRPVAARYTGYWTGSSPRSCGCSASGARSTARIASSLTAARIWTGRGSRRPACAGCWSARAAGAAGCSAGASRRSPGSKRPGLTVTTGPDTYSSRPRGESPRSSSLRLSRCPQPPRGTDWDGQTDDASPRRPGFA
jgi:transposase